MIRTIYLIILTYFLLGGIGFYLINRNKEARVARKSYTKFIAYFFIINLLFFSIVVKPVLFTYLAALIVGVGFYELFKLFRLSRYQLKGFFGLSLFIYTVLSTGFFLFSSQDKGLILFSFLILSIFDSFSQISGQLWGRTKLLPEISPNKTVGGLVGGTLVAMASSLLLDDLYDGLPLKSVWIAAGVVFFAFAGDVAASYYKRKYQVKDFSQLIPGHGGFLDRFDSLIAGGAWVAFGVYIFNF
ncbi:phosphatidate cytidylyltransferase [Gaoshiqia sp. Z1-71]|uniref:phosphatidate cytidylyltransferase n=1 Tax=Gaoshiqia hydrogeniformans TaxID=3290090 RepID=UPI003BF87F13